MVKAEIEMLKKSLFSLKLFWEQDDECLHTGTKLKKITKKVEINIASEASNVNILSGQKFIKNGRFWRVFENLNLAVKQCYQTGLLFKQYDFQL